MPKIKITLAHKIEGVFVISNPEGWDQAISQMTRHETFFSVVEYYSVSFKAYGDNGVENGGRDWLKMIGKKYGPDGFVQAIIEEAPDDSNAYKLIYIGSAISDTFNEDNDFGHTINFALSPVGFWAALLSGYDKPVDIKSAFALNGNAMIPTPSISIKLTSQKILQRSVFNQIKAYDYGSQYTPAETSPDFFYEIKENQFIGINLEDETISEVTTNNYVAQVGTDERPLGKWVMEYDGTYEFDLKFNYCLKVAKYGIDPGTAEGYLTMSGLMKVFIQINDDEPVEFTTTDVGTPWGGHVLGHVYSEYTKYEFLETLDLRRGDIVRVYGKDQGEGFGYGNNTATVFFFQLVLLGEDNTGILWSGQVPPTDPPEDLDTHMYVTANTTFPANITSGFFVHDVFAGIIERITGVQNSFHSPYFGSPYTNKKAYDVEGKAWKLANLRGLQMRDYTLEEKPFAQSLKDQFEGIDPTHNIGLGYKIIDGQDVVYIDKKSAFFDSTNVSTRISNVRKISSDWDQAYLFNQFEFGYTDGQVEEILGIDDPQITRIWTDCFQYVGKKFSQLSNMIAASVAFEMTRRATRTKSADNKLDDKTFLLCIEPSEDLDADYQPQLLEPFAAVTNLINSDTRYNILLSVAHNFLRWRDFISGQLQCYLDTTFNFGEGKGNFDMTSQMVDNGEPEAYEGATLSEKGNIPVGIDFLFIPLPYTIETDLSREQYEAIQANPHWSIEVSQTESEYVKFFIKDAQYIRHTEDYKLIAWPKSFLDIQTINNPSDEQHFIFTDPFEFPPFN